MIGWENDRGAYYINKLDEKVNNLSDSVDDSIAVVEGKIGKLTDLKTSSKSSIVSAVNELSTAFISLGHVTANAQGTGHIDYTVDSNGRFIVIVTGAATVRMGIWFVSVSSGGTVVAQPIMTPGNKVTLTSSESNTITITSLEEGSYQLDVFAVQMLETIKVKEG